MNIWDLNVSVCITIHHCKYYTRVQHVWYIYICTHTVGSFKTFRHFSIFLDFDFFLLKSVWTVCILMCLNLHEMSQFSRPFQIHTTESFTSFIFSNYCLYLIPWNLLNQILKWPSKVSIVNSFPSEHED